MTKAIYGVGDQIFLVPGPFRTARSEGAFTIVTVLPDAQGSAQYRVKSNDENFERRITGSEIDIERSPRRAAVLDAAPEPGPKKGSWLNASTIRVGKS